MRMLGWSIMIIGAVLSIMGFDISYLLLVIGMGVIYIGFGFVLCTPSYEKWKCKKVSEKFKDLFEFDKETGIFKLYKRDKILLKYIKIIADKAVSIKYEPEKLNFGAVAVGGVVSGGFYKTGGYNYISAITKNGKYRLEFFGNIIRRIELTPELYANALKSPIAQIVSSSHEIKVVADAYYSPEDVQMFLYQVQKTGFASDELLKRGFPSLEKCTAILGWMAKDID